MIMETVDKIWANYDKDGNGVLDKAECFKFVADTLTGLGQDSNELSEDAFNEAFTEYDADGTGQLSKNEMVAYIKKLVPESVE